MIGWNGHHTAVTLPDGTPVSSGEGGGVRVGGGGAYQPKFTHHMYLPMDVDAGKTSRRRQMSRSPRSTTWNRKCLHRARPSARR